MSAPVNDRDALEALLPFYVAGTLDAADRARVDVWIAGDPAGRAALAAAEAEASAVVATHEAVMPPEDALARFARRLEGEAGPAARAMPGGWLARLRSAPVLGWALAAVLFFVVAVEGLMLVSRGGPQLAGVDTPPAGGPSAIVAFRADAGAAAITAALRDADASIVDGPRAGGLFIVRFAPGTALDTRVAAFRTSGVLESFAMQGSGP